MNQRLVNFLLCLCLSMSCARPDKNPKIEEAEHYLTEFTDGKKRILEVLYNDCKRQAATSDEELLSRCTALHRVCNNFYTLADSVGNLYRELPSNEERASQSFRLLDSVYALTIDSIQLYFPKAETHRNNSSSIGASLLLSASSRKYNVMRAHHRALEFFLGRISNRFRHSYRDDGSGLSTTHFPTDGYRYGFAVKNKFMQQFPYREIIIDSVIRDGTKTNVIPEIGNRDIIRVAELRNLKRGKYLVRINVGDIHFFSHRFQIKK